MNRLLTRAMAALCVLIVGTAVAVGVRAPAQVEAYADAARPVPAPTTARKMDE